MAKKVTGIDIGDASVRLVELTVAGKTVRVTGFLEYPVENNDVGKSLRKIVDEKKVDLKSVCTGFRAERVFQREIILPFSDKKRVSQTLPFSLADTLPFPIDEAVYAYYRPKIVDGKAQVVSLTVKKEALRDFEQPFSEAGITPSVISAESAAIARAVVPLSEGDAPFLSVHIDFQKTTVNFVEGQAALLSRTINFGVRDIISGLSEGLKINEDEAMGMIFSGIEKGEKCSLERGEKIVRVTLDRLIREIELALRSFGTSHDAGSVVVVSGEGAKIKGLSEYIEEETDIRAAPPAIGKNIQVDAGISRKDLLHKGTVALGYALIGIDDSNVNFIKGRNRFMESSLIRALYSQRKTVAAGSAALLLLYSLNLAADVTFKKKRYLELKREIREIFRSTLPDVKRIVNEKHQLKTALGRLEEKASVISDEGSVMIVEILREISTQVPEDVTFRVTRMRIGKDEVKIEGETNNFDGVEKIKTAIKNVGIFKSVEVGGAKASRLQGIVEFKLKVKLWTEKE